MSLVLNASTKGECAWFFRAVKRPAGRLSRLVDGRRDVPRAFWRALAGMSRSRVAVASPLTCTGGRGGRGKVGGGAGAGAVGRGGVGVGVGEGAIKPR